MFFVPLTAAKHHLGTLLMILNKCFIKITFSVHFSAEDLQNTDDTSDEGAFPLHSNLSHLARSGTLSYGNLDIRFGPVGAQGVFRSG